MNAATFAGNVTMNGNVVLGNASADTISPGGTWAASLIPNATNTYNLGSSSAVWNSLYLNMTTGSIAFIGANGLVSQDNSNLFWDDTNNILNIGKAASRQNYFNTTGVYPGLQTEAASGGPSYIASVRNTNDASGSFFIAGKSRGASVNTNTVVQSGDTVGGISFQGADGTNLVEAARIFGAVDGTPGTGDMPGRLVFFTTADGAATGTERMRIDSSGNVGIGTATPSSLLNLATNTSNGTTIELTTGTTGEGGEISFKTSNGTVASPTNSSSQVLGDFWWKGYGGAAYRNGALIRSSQTGSYTSNSVPASLEFYTGDGTNAIAQRMVIDSSGNVGIGVTPTARNNTTFQIKDGIGFPATQVASSDVNTLDDYEEGSWTPSVGGTATYNVQSGVYTKIGNKVFIQGRLAINVIGTGSQSAISGLPFTSNGSEPFGGITVTYWSVTAANYVYLTGLIGTSATTIGLYAATAASASIASVNAMTNSTEIRFQGQYQV